jgi:hypothetical protein
VNKGQNMETTGEPEWYALRVVPQKEYVVARLLERKPGVWAYVPTGTSWRKRTRYNKSDVEYAKPEMPGCIFARFPGSPAWYDVLKNHLIIAPIGRNGEPWVFDPVELHLYFARIPNGTLTLRDGEAVVQVAGRTLRAPRTQVKHITKRKPEMGVAEPTRQEETVLGAFLAHKNASPLRQAA